MAEPTAGPGAGSLRRVLGPALLFGGLFGAFAFAIQLASPLRIVLGSLAMALLWGLVAYRMARGRTLLPTAGLVILGVGALALYTWAFIVGDRPAGSEWIAVVIVFAIPVGILVLAYRQWRSG